MQWMVALLFVLFQFLPDFIYGCTPRYQEELQYLDYYLGIQPENQGNLEVEGMILFKIKQIFCKKTKKKRDN